VAPSFALEVVALDPEKDYVDNPPLYGELGVKELVLFDPHARKNPARYRFQIYRAMRGRGLRRVEATNADRVESKVLGCFLRVIGAGDRQRLRLATGNGDDLVPTPEEQLDMVRATAERERAAKEQERAAKEQERSARLALEAELAELRHQLAGKKRRK
jgi:hypothetical protein